LIINKPIMTGIMSLVYRKHICDDIIE